MIRSYLPLRHLHVNIPSHPVAENNIVHYEHHNKTLRPAKYLCPLRITAREQKFPWKMQHQLLRSECIWAENEELTICCVALFVVIMFPKDCAVMPHPANRVHVLPSCVCVVQVSICWHNTAHSSSDLLGTLSKTLKQGSHQLPDNVITHVNKTSKNIL